MRSSIKTKNEHRLLPIWEGRVLPNPSLFVLNCYNFQQSFFFQFYGPLGTSEGEAEGLRRRQVNENYFASKSWDSAKRIKNKKVSDAVSVRNEFSKYGGCKVRDKLLKIMNSFGNPINWPDFKQ